MSGIHQSALAPLAFGYKSVISLRFAVKSLIIKEMKEMAIASLPSRVFYSFYLYSSLKVQILNFIARLKRTDQKIKMHK